MSSPREILSAALARHPLVAILRGVRPDEVEAIADAIVAAGFTMIEVPLNSPDPLASIERLSRRYGEDVLVGAGTVLSPGDVEAVARAGGRLIVSPNVNGEVIRASAAKGLLSLPGFFTPSEAFAAIEAGATGLKLFPAEGASPVVLKAMRAVLPKDMPVFAVGGVGVANLGEWMAAGADGAGLGSGLYKPGMSAEEVGARAAEFSDALRNARAA
ncbi:2-dehydro-3-deoxy-6-phosphogalactonate aldolase [Novosphingobium flavum]|uniref:2-dehydro-3-deoxy-6-phosphogalactonate aldolase n=1 Tax=Novosphingobium flavum TaxID=1778672 RepID=A0A7X1FUP8_9SPHN|nr:2-dehydro-3-deoxy-6-phosphogalactonate aldolase [Novosphingobium flavum]MBC2667321.1 2-dehydro-3-deoxy-6-phosphogalactonate aldolase [Novosphingobium flavum]